MTDEELRITVTQLLGRFEAAEFALSMLSALVLPKESHAREAYARLLEEAALRVESVPTAVDRTVFVEAMSSTFNQMAYKITRSP